MKYPSSHHKWILIGFLLFIIVGLTACVRPAETPDATLPTPTSIEVINTPQAFPTATPLPTAPPIDAQPTPEPTNEPAPEPTAVPPEQGGETGTQTIHVVTSGDTLYNLSQRYTVSMDDIIAVNNLGNPNNLAIGQEIIIPAPGSVPPPEIGSERTHVVSPGENLFRIGQQYGCTVDQLSAYNNIPYPYTIYVGDQVLIPADC